MNAGVIIQYILTWDAPVILLFIIIIFLINRGWNIPVVILRFTGNKERPLFIYKKAKKKIIAGVPKLHVRGYKAAVNDYKSIHYFPTIRSPHGALILWEFEDGLLAPTIPTRIEKKLTDDEKDLLMRFRELVMSKTAVKFTFDEELYKNLRLKAVDDVDIEGMIYELARQEGQYLPGWSRFLQQYGGVLGIIIVAILILVIVVTFFNKAPELAAQCAQSAVTNSQELIKQTIDKIGLTPPG